MGGDLPLFVRERWKEETPPPPPKRGSFRFGIAVFSFGLCVLVGAIAMIASRTAHLSDSASPRFGAPLPTPHESGSTRASTSKPSTGSGTVPSAMPAAKSTPDKDEERSLVRVQYREPLKRDALPPSEDAPDPEGGQF